MLSAAGNGSEAKGLVSCGVSFGGQRLAVVNPETLVECAAGEVGEIWIAGPSVAAGYGTSRKRLRTLFMRGSPAMVMSFCALVIWGSCTKVSSTLPGG